MTHEHPNRISLDDVDKYSADELPLIDTGSPIPKADIDDLLDEDRRSQIEDRVLPILREAILALRGEVAPNFLIPLMLADNLTIGQIAGRAHIDPRDIKENLELLVELGFVKAVDTDTAPRQYTLLPQPLAGIQI